MALSRYVEWYEYEPLHGKTQICDECGEHIQTDYKWNIDGRVYCDDCAKKLFRETNEAE